MHTVTKTYIMNFIVLILFVIPLICNAQVSTQVTINGQCTGSIIQEHWIVTSASCALLNAPITSVSVGGLNYGVQQVITHPNYVQNQADNDIALIKLNTNINGIQPIVMELNNAADYRTLTVYVNGPFTGSQAYQIVDESQCGLYGYNTRNLICAVPLYGQQFDCQVGTGSPVINSNQIIGLESGVYQCASPVHVFTRVSRHRAWILNQIQLYNYNQPYYYAG